ncbi:EAL domain-containing protein [Brevundimonas sp.]|uniref:EAL domain-containing protein n=1 Tax=Brevundimonas sp. TaxID=1871086 RepID=UPI00263382F8|nr:EAL domain-containing protein [Brevundimonas sp.]
MTIRTSLLGFAFASADLLLELDKRGSTVLGLGSGPTTGLSAESFNGVALWNRVAPASVDTLNGVLKSLRPGARSAPVELLFNAGEGRMRRATARFFLLPDLAPNISCSVTWEGPAYRLHDPEAAPALEPEAFLARAQQMMAPPAEPRDLAIAFVNVEGLAAAQGMGEAGERLNARVEAALQAASVDGATAGKLGPEKFALLRDRSEATDLAGEMEEIGRDEGFELFADSTESDLTAGGESLSALRALRVAVEGCLRDGGSGRPDLSFTAALSQTLKDAHAFQTMVKGRRFELHYQPIVDLKTGAVHHFEALARFRGSDSPADAIHMAEEMALIDSFDVAVAEKALSRLRQPGAGLLKFAVNVSGASLADDRYVQALLRMTSARPDERKRLIVEVTESAALSDVEAANRRLGGLRSAGIKVCIDDFGAGAASYDYLRRLSVDTVKIDGTFIQGLETDPRARTLIGHLVELCRSLKIETIAEMIETEADAEVLRELGVDLGQGWLFGKAEAEPRTQLAYNEPVMSRRVGAVASWG